MSDKGRIIGALVGIVVVILSIVAVIVQYRDCSEKRGVLVKGPFMLVCIEQGRH